MLFKNAAWKIALFCKFRYEGQPVRFANVCNVRWLLQLSRRAEAGGQTNFFLHQPSIKESIFSTVFSNC